MTEQVTPDPSAEESIFDESEFSMAGYDKHVRNARITLYILSGLILLSIALLPHMEGPTQWIIIGGTVLLAGIFTAFGLWSRKQPYIALLSALILFVVIVALDAVIAPSSLVQAWQVKLAVIVLLILGVRNAKEIKDRAEAFGKR